MHNTTKIRIFRVLLRLTWLPSVLLLYPLAIFRKRLAAKHIFLFDRYSLGGAQRVHLDILGSIPAVAKMVYFTRYSPNSVMKAAFESAPNTVCKDIHFWCDNLLFRLFAVHYWAFYFNRHRHLTILSSNSTFFYDLLPWLRSGIVKIELLHNFTYGRKGMEAFGLANYSYLNKRVTVDHFTAGNIKDQYAKHNIDPAFNARILVIEPGVDLPASIPNKQGAELKILYAGRGGAQKRVWLIDRIAKQCKAEGLPVQFHFAGDAEGELSEEVKSEAVIHGQISEPDKMVNLYRDSDVIILTSAYEGFPMFIKEGMANACIPVVTALPGNKTHLTHLQNALLIESVEDETKVVEQGMSNIRLLLRDKELKRMLHENAYEYAKSHFSKPGFITAYSNLLS
jgi:glycosyltransferase involved in cell wall biosynthesis